MKTILTALPMLLFVLFANNASAQNLSSCASEDCIRRQIDVHNITNLYLCHDFKKKTHKIACEIHIISKMKIIDECPRDYILNQECTKLFIEINNASRISVCNYGSNNSRINDCIKTFINHNYTGTAPTSICHENELNQDFQERCLIYVHAKNKDTWDCNTINTKTIKEQCGQLLYNRLYDFSGTISKSEKEMFITGCLVLPYTTNECLLMLRRKTNDNEICSYISTKEENISSLSTHHRLKCEYGAIVLLIPYIFLILSSAILFILFRIWRKNKKRSSVLLGLIAVLLLLFFCFLPGRYSHLLFGDSFNVFLFFFEIFNVIVAAIFFPVSFIVGRPLYMMDMSKFDYFTISSLITFIIVTLLHFIDKKIKNKKSYRITIAISGVLLIIVAVLLTIGLIAGGS